jgi:hypothetical protein
MLSDPSVVDTIQEYSAQWLGSTDLDRFLEILQHDGPPEAEQFVSVLELDFIIRGYRTVVGEQPP